jgi:hypothetical protein
MIIITTGKAKFKGVYMKFIKVLLIISWIFLIHNFLTMLDIMAMSKIDSEGFNLVITYNVFTVFVLNVIYLYFRIKEQDKKLFKED